MIQLARMISVLTRSSCNSKEIFHGGDVRFSAGWAGRAILVDFSLARIGLDRAPDGKATTFCGSAAYAAPEMISRE